jgi:hypothetical protein
LHPRVCSCWNSILWALVVMILSYFRVLLTLMTLLAAWPNNLIISLVAVWVMGNITFVAVWGMNIL